MKWITFRVLCPSERVAACVSNLESHLERKNSSRGEVNRHRLPRRRAYKYSFFTTSRPSNIGRDWGLFGRGCPHHKVRARIVATVLNRGKPYAAEDHSCSDRPDSCRSSNLNYLNGREVKSGNKLGEKFRTLLSVQQIVQTLREMGAETRAPGNRLLMT